MRRILCAIGVLVFGLESWAQAEMIFPAANVMNVWNTANSNCSVNQNSDGTMIMNLSLNSNQNHANFSGQTLLKMHDLSVRGTAFQFEVKCGEEPKESTKIFMRIIDAKGGICETEPITVGTAGSIPEWVSVTLSFEDFYYWDRGVRYNWENGNFLWYQIKEIQLLIKADTVNVRRSVNIRKINVVDAVGITVNAITVENCETAAFPPNENLNGLGVKWNMEGEAIFKQDSWEEAPTDHFWEITPTKETSEEKTGIWEFLSDFKGNTANPNYYINGNYYNHLSFWFRIRELPQSENNEERFRVQLKSEEEAKGRTIAVYIRNYMPQSKLDKSKYKLDIPLCDFYAQGTADTLANYLQNPVALNKFTTLTFLATVGGIFDIDDIQFYHSVKGTIFETWNSGDITSPPWDAVNPSRTLVRNIMDDAGQWECDVSFSAVNEQDDAGGIVKRFYVNALADIDQTGTPNSFALTYQVSPELVNCFVTLLVYDSNQTAWNAIFQIPAKASNNWQTQILYYNDGQDKQKVDLRKIEHVELMVVSSLPNKMIAGTLTLKELKTTCSSPSVVEIHPEYKGYAKPNPFLPVQGQNTTFVLPRADLDQHYKIQILNVNGKVVKCLNDNNQWDGKNENGSYCEGGVYIYQIEIGAKCYSGQVVLIK